VRGPHPLRAAAARFAAPTSTVDWPRERLAREGPPRGVPVFDEGACTACGECVAVCPASALEVPEGASSPVVDAGSCVRCGMCVAACPDGGASLEGPDELAAYSRADLVVRHGVPPGAQDVGPSPSWVYRLAVGLSPHGSVRPAGLLERRLRGLKKDG
jgi:formate hydrogenlyase subunit 6/NADH:ubiquinone oxidoreductase subunit I